MAECAFPDHKWDPTSSSSPWLDEVKFACANCGVGHEVTFDKRTPGQVTTCLRVFPAQGSRTINRAVIRWSILAHEANLADIRATGIDVIDEPSLIDGTPVGD
jgi:hypothetical protein